MLIPNTNKEGYSDILDKELAKFFPTDIEFPPLENFFIVLICDEELYWNFPGVL
jgi:hypothetical protein